MAFQIGYSVEYVEVHEEEIVGHIKQFVLLAMLLQVVATEGSQIEQHLQRPDEGVDGACIHEHQEYVEGDECQEGKGSDGPAQYAMGHELEGHGEMTEGIHHRA